MLLSAKRDPIYTTQYVMEGKMELDDLNSGKRFDGIYTDALGFIRKKRNNIGFLLWIAVGIAYIGLNSLVDDYYILALAFWPISAYLLLLAIQMASSHDIDTWKGTPYVKLWIFIGNLFGGLLGLIVYGILKWREKNYLKKRLGTSFPVR